MEARFPHGVPSLIECKHLGIQGDIKFGRNISVKGRVKLANETNLQIRVEDGTVLKGG
jgi:UTP--glucose-1-phosphate uridylyltransferase